MTVHRTTTTRYIEAVDRYRDVVVVDVVEMKVIKQVKYAIRSVRLLLWPHIICAQGNVEKYWQRTLSLAFHMWRRSAG